MNAPVIYEVEATIADRETAERWVAWMLDEHLADVRRCGALNGRLIELDGSNHHFVAQYEFASRNALDAYLNDHAPRLRSEGASLFPSDKVAYTRRIGLIHTKKPPVFHKA